MGYFDGIAGLYFKKDAGGKTVYYPWRIVGKGYVMPDEAAEKEARGFIRLFMMVTLPVIVIAVNISWIWAVAAMAGLAMWYYLKTRALVAGRALSLEKLTFEESYTNSAKAHNIAVLWLLFIISLLFTAASLWFAFGGAVHCDRLMMCVSSFFFAFCSVSLGYMIKKR